MQTVADVRRLIRKAKAVYVRPFFGVMEAWVRISKPEAQAMFVAHSADKTILEAFDYDHTLCLSEDDCLYLG